MQKTSSRWRLVAKEPIVQFLLLGAAMFIAFDLLSPADPADANNPHTIRVDRQSLLRYMQHQAKSFDEPRFAAQLDAASPEQRQRLIDEVLAEEALYREAKAWGLDQNDYTAKRRLIQRLESILQGMESLGSEVTDSELNTYHQANIAAYYEPATITFTHVFVAKRPKSEISSEAQAQTLLAVLRQKPVVFHEALGYGDRFLYHRNYVNKQADLIASHFGVNLQAAVFALPASEQTWQGPFASPYGHHLVLVTQQVAGFDPALDSIADRVRQDVRWGKRQKALTRTKARIIEGYQVELGDDLNGSASAPATQVDTKPMAAKSTGALQP